MPALQKIEMKLSPTWLREFVDPKVDNLRLAQDLTSVGIAVEGITGDGENAVFEMEIGTNRPDAMNHYGVAREASVDLQPAVASRSQPKLPVRTERLKTRFQIEIADGRVAPRYTARIVRDVSIKPSPAAIARRLALGRSAPHQQRRRRYQLHAVGDGHPTHVFDLDLLEGGKILVRRASRGETSRRWTESNASSARRSGHRRCASSRSRWLV